MIFPFIYYPKILPFTKNDEKIIDPFIIYSMFFFYLRTAKKKFNLNINDTICLRKYIQKYIFIYKSACKRNLIFLILCIKFQYAFSYSKFTNCTNLQAKVYETSIQSFIFNETIFAKY